MHTVYRLGRGFSSWGTTPLFRGSFSTLPIKQAFQTPVSFNRVASSVFARQYSSPTNAKPPHPSESFLSGNSSVVLEEMYENWRQDPNSVHSSWSEFFRSVEGNLPPGQAIPVPKRYSKFAQTSSVSASVATAGQYNAAESLRIFLLVRAYRVLGHFLADLDPLHLQSPNFMRVREEYTRDLDPKTYGFTEADMDREFYVGEDLPGNKPVRTLREIINLMKTCYCGKIGVQYMHSASPFLKSWIRERFESGDRLYNFSREEKLKIYANLAKAELFEEFLNKKFQQAKRFGLNGGEALIPGLEALVERAAQHNIGSVVFGMPHRGRLSVMANTLNKPLYQIFNEFKMDKEALDMGVQGSGDVKYHLGTSSDRNFDGRDIHMSMTANPSHLEAVNPVVEGKCRAKQEKRGQVDFKRALSVLIHGDAAFAGQGVVGETLELSGLEDFTTGGTVHVIVNNQIGFTTVPKFSRSSPYPSEIAKANGAPVFHVNGDDPEAVVHTMKLAMDFREQFHNDVVVDIYCYRRFGHNELDEPRFTQPQMYQLIDKHDSALPIYRKQLLSQGVCTEEELKKIEDNINNIFAEGYNAREHYKQIDADWLECNWKGFKGPQQRAKIQKTGVALEVLQELGSKLTHVPAEYNIHPKLQKRLSNQQEMIKTGQGVDWALGEALAFGSLLREGYDVRLSGQDCERGTFSHRHSVLHCQTSGRTYTPLEHLHPSQGYFNVINSSLSENAVLGFEHGYSLEDPNRLVMWEGQFGDFSNGAQVIIDQFISSGEQKWLRMSGLTMLLPHGYEGQGPEHSSARPERYLQLCDEDMFTIPADISDQAQKINMQVVNCTTPSNYFHVLRRQIHREYRKPLVVMTPKFLLNYIECRSPLSDFGPGQQFKRAIPEICEDRMAADNAVNKVIFCWGKVYFDLKKERERLYGNKPFDVAIVRLEEMAPFPFDKVLQQAQKYPNARVVWVQEEPQNQGAWTYALPRLHTATGQIPRYVGRPASAAPATGVTFIHKRELEHFLRDAFSC